MQEKREIMLFIGNPMGRSIMRKHKGRFVYKGRRMYSPFRGRLEMKW